jgi:hypothetical protein
LRKSGKAIWAAIVASLGLDPQEEHLLLEACRVADRLDGLDAVLRREGLTLPDSRPHPALVESRQQEITLTRLIASLRLPEDLAEPDRRPQRRGAARISYMRRKI